MKKKYFNSIVSHYEECLKKHGDNNLGVDWPDIDDVEKRYSIMLDIIRINNDSSDKLSLLDFGCGAAHLLEYIKSKKLSHLNYSGLDISEKFISLCKNKFPGTDFYCTDVLDSGNTLPGFDYIIMNGVFTEKRELSFDEMWNYFKEMISKVYPLANKGIGFNVMSKNVDWEREDLFHLSHDLLSDFLCNNITRKYIIRNDYGLYEYTTYLFK